MKYAKLVVPVLALTMVMSACSNKAEETTESTTAAETTTEATTTETEAEDTEADEESEEGMEEDWEPFFPDQNIEIDENYMKYYDYQKYYDMDFMEEQPEAKEEEITDDILKEEYKKLVADGFKVYTADSEAAYLSGEGFYDDDMNGIAYLYRGITGYIDTEDSYRCVREYIVSQEILDQLDYIKGEEENGIITYKEADNKQCPTGATITYDTANQLLKFDYTLVFDGEAVG